MNYLPSLKTMLRMVAGEGMQNKIRSKAPERIFIWDESSISRGYQELRVAYYRHH